MNDTKIRLSKEELALVKEGGWILTKNEIIQKVVSFFGEIATVALPLVQARNLPPEIKESTPKISRGENYRGLPYVVLDYPRLFSKDHVFAIRILFWWAHYFTVTLHLKGTYREIFGDLVLSGREQLAAHGFYIFSSPDEWLHALDPGHYLAMAQCTPPELEAIIRGHQFTKIAAMIGLDQWDEMESLIMDRYRILLEVLAADQLPRR